MLMVLQQNYYIIMYTVRESVIGPKMLLKFFFFTKTSLKNTKYLKKNIDTELKYSCKFKFYEILE